MTARRRAATAAAALIAAVALQTLPVRGAELDLSDLMKKPAYRKAYLAMIAGAKDLPFWLDEITGGENYVTAPGDRVTIGGTIYVLFNACQPHECDVNALEVMFSPGGAPAYALLLEDGQPKRWLGNPNAAQQMALSEASQ